MQQTSPAKTTPASPFASAGFSIGGLNIGGSSSAKKGGATMPNLDFLQQFGLGNLVQTV